MSTAFDLNKTEPINNISPEVDIPPTTFFEQKTSALETDYSTNIDSEKYEDVMGDISVYDTPEEMERKRIEGIPTSRTVGQLLGNMIPNISAELVRSIGSLVALGTEWSTDDKDYSNFLTEAADIIKNPYGTPERRNPNETWDITDPAWWNNITGVVESAAAFVAAGYGVGAVLGKGSTAVARGLANMYESSKAINNISKAGSIISQVGTSAALSYMEGAQIAAGVYKEVYDDAYNRVKLQNPNISEELAVSQAKEQAGQAAATTAQINTILGTIVNTTSVGSMFKTNPFLSNLEKSGVRQLAGETTEQYIKRIEAIIPEFDRTKLLNKVGKEAGQEALEEGVINSYAEYKGKEVGGIKQGSFAERVFSEQGALEATLGALGGVAQTSVIETAPIHSKINEDGTVGRESGIARENRLRARQYSDYIKTLTEDSQFAITKGDELVNAKTDSERDEIKDDLFNNFANQSINKGAGENLISTLNQVKAIDNKDLRVPLQTEVAKIDSELEQLGTVLAQPELTPVEKNKLTEQITALNNSRTELVKDINTITASGKYSNAMKLGYANSLEDNNYVALAEERINDIKILSEQKRILDGRYNFTYDEELSGLSDYLFSLYNAQHQASRQIDKWKNNISNYELQVRSELEKLGNTSEYINKRIDKNKLVALQTLKTELEVLQDKLATASPKEQKKLKREYREVIDKKNYNSDDITKAIKNLDKQIKTINALEEYKGNLNAQESELKLESEKSLLEANKNLATYESENSIYAEEYNKLTTKQGRKDYIKNWQDSVIKVQTQSKEKFNKYINEVKDEKTLSKLKNKYKDNKEYEDVIQSRIDEVQQSAQKATDKAKPRPIVKENVTVNRTANAQSKAKDSTPTVEDTTFPPTGVSSETVTTSRSITEQNRATIASAMDIMNISKLNDIITADDKGNLILNLEGETKEQKVQVLYDMLLEPIPNHWDSGAMAVILAEMYDDLVKVKTEVTDIPISADRSISSMLYNLNYINDLIIATTNESMFKTIIPNSDLAIKVKQDGTFALNSNDVSELEDAELDEDVVFGLPANDGKSNRSSKAKVFDKFERIFNDVFDASQPMYLNWINIVNEYRQANGDKLSVKMYANLNLLFKFRTGLNNFDIPYTDIFRSTPNVQNKEEDDVTITNDSNIPNEQDLLNNVNDFVISKSQSKIEQAATSAAYVSVDWQYVKDRDGNSVKEDKSNTKNPKLFKPIESSYFMQVGEQVRLIVDKDNELYDEHKEHVDEVPIAIQYFYNGKWETAAYIHTVSWINTQDSLNNYVNVADDGTGSNPATQTNIVRELRQTVIDNDRASLATNASIADKSAGYVRINYKRNVDDTISQDAQGRYEVDFRLANEVLSPSMIYGVVKDSDITFGKQLVRVPYTINDGLRKAAGVPVVLLPSPNGIYQAHPVYVDRITQDNVDTIIGAISKMNKQEGATIGINNLQDLKDFIGKYVNVVNRFNLSNRADENRSYIMVNNKGIAFGTTNEGIYYNIYYNEDGSVSYVRDKKPTSREIIFKELENVLKDLYFSPKIDKLGMSGTIKEVQMDKEGKVLKTVTHANYNSFMLKNTTTDLNPSKAVYKQVYTKSNGTSSNTETIWFDQPNVQIQTSVTTSVVEPSTKREETTVEFSNPMLDSMFSADINTDIEAVVKDSTNEEEFCK